MTHPGETLRALREERSFTLRELAKKCGIPASTLSKLENGKMAMTYPKLVQLALSLEVDMGRLIEVPEPAREQMPLGRRSIVKSGDGGTVKFKKNIYSYPAADFLNKLMVPIVIDVGNRKAEDVGGMIMHSGEEYLYVLEGSMELHSNLYAPLPLSQGDSIYFDSGMAHVYINTGETPCRLLVICAGEDVYAVASAMATESDT